MTVPRRKLTGEQVADIRAQLRRGRSQRYLSAAYGVSQGHISMINTERVWKQRARFDHTEASR